MTCTMQTFNKYLNELLSHRRRSLPVIVFSMFPFPECIPLGGSDCSLYSVYAAAFCMLFRLSGGKSPKSQEYLPYLFPYKRSGGCKKINLEKRLRDTSLHFFFSFYLFIYLFIYLWLHWAFVAVHRLSLVVVSGGYSRASHCGGFSCCRAQVLGAQAQ